jgi:putative salt-induced outer membrane protein YdiY
MLPFLLLLPFLFALQDPPPNSPWQGKADFGLTLLTGNNQNTNVDFHGELKQLLEGRRWILRGDYSGVRQGNPVDGSSTTVSRLTHISAEHHRYLDEVGDFYGYGKSSGRRDPPNGLELRADLGFGIGWIYHWSKSQNTLTLEVGPSLLREDNVGTEKVDTWSGRAAAELSIPLMETWEFNSKGEYFASTEDGADRSFTNRVSLAWNFKEDWYLKFGNSLAWDGTPAPGFSETDIRWSINIGTQF